MAAGVGPDDRSPMPLDPAQLPVRTPFPLGPGAPDAPDRWGPLGAPDRWRWAGLLQACSQEWSSDASRLRALVRSGSVNGPCGAALVSLGDAIAAEMSAVAVQVAHVAAGPLLSPGAVR
jgi:hypothetical protein